MKDSTKKSLPWYIPVGFIVFLFVIHEPSGSHKKMSVDEQIKSIQADIKARATSVYYTEQSNKIAAKKGIRAFREGVTNPLGPSEDNKEDYANAIKDVDTGEKMIAEDLAAIEEDKKKIDELKSGAQIKEKQQ